MDGDPRSAIVPATSVAFTRRGLLIGGALAGVAAVTGGIAVRQHVRDKARRGLDVYDARNAGWLTYRAPDPGDYDRCNDLSDLLAHTDLACVGSVTGAVRGFAAYDESSRSNDYRAGYQIRIDEVLAGGTDSGTRTIRLDVVSTAGPIRGSDLDDIAAGAPKGELVMLLTSVHAMVRKRDEDRHPGTLARTLNAYYPAGLVQGVFLQGPDGVVSVFDNQRDQWASGDVAARFPTLGALAEAVEHRAAP